MGAFLNVFSVFRNKKLMLISKSQKYQYLHKQKRAYFAKTNYQQSNEKKNTVPTAHTKDFHVKQGCSFISPELLLRLCIHFRWANRINRMFLLENCLNFRNILNKSMTVVESVYYDLMVINCRKLEMYFLSSSIFCVLKVYFRPNICIFSAPKSLCF